MIEINLMPRGEGRPAPGSRSSAAASALRAASLWPVAMCLPGLTGLLMLAILHTGAWERHRVIEARISQAVRDSTELADLIVATEQLRARRDSISARVEIIQQLDRGRYLWPHILDEVALAMPEFTWLTRIVQVEVESDPTVQIEGRAGNTFALTSYMNQLENSPVLHAVELVTTEQVAERLPDGGEWTLSSFVLRVGYRPRGARVSRSPLSAHIQAGAGAARGQP